jgi:tRNA1Val (adenine37-N6)-methyltransferase|uniref:tRNA1(Val) (adenine(37)-N6)-methyltransferase n=1 Tax=uncultured Flavobacteriia bacterium TaxID=212695 RepID=H6RE77_9BACT|nr:tRNA (adenine-N(6)-)-methyltransferase [uncultured bacterium]AOE12098.1 methyltransferase [uncultured bacterium]AOE12637.1 tRNA (adenine-N(6)-)-methyltransferase [uncultured bacterium]CCF99338.1 methyltransferase [uncultured Flavobacteriia bacterium]|tara:strand:+ start:1305 stop:2021 length:717 start_codon:yes stop_codon:yes gene_type:complete
MKPFNFKRFTVHQDKCAMKIGTDGVLLAAWANPKNAFSILDIGSGSGLISLQMAQKSNAEVIDAIEIDDDAFEQTVENFERSDWGDRLFCYHASLQEFTEEMEDEVYDFIISNPPFYNSTFKSEEISEKRALARHTKSLSFDVLLSSTSKLLSEIGECAFIIPYGYEEEFFSIGKQVGLFPNRITRVKGTREAPIKRSLLQLSFRKTTPEISELVIEIDRHVYTPEYIDLVKYFYVKM